MRQRLALLLLLPTVLIASGCDLSGDLFRDDHPAPPIVPTHRYTGFDGSGAVVATGFLQLEAQPGALGLLGRWQVRVVDGVTTDHFRGEGTLWREDPGVSIPERILWRVQDTNLDLGPIERQVWLLDGTGIGFPSRGTWTLRRDDVTFGSGAFEIVPLDR